MPCHSTPLWQPHPFLLPLPHLVSLSCHSIAPTVSSQPISPPSHLPRSSLPPTPSYGPYPVLIPSPSTRYLSVPILMAAHPSSLLCPTVFTLVPFPISNSNSCTLGSLWETLGRRGLLRIYRTCPPQTLRPFSCSILGPRYFEPQFTVPTALHGFIDT